MRGLFVHDFRAIKYNDQYYTTNLSYEIWKGRYLQIFDEMEICCRVVKTNEDVSKSMVLSSGEGIIFNESMPLFRGPEVLIDGKAKKNLKNAIERADAVIIRVGSLLGTIASDICKKLGKPYLTEVVSCAWDATWNHGIYGKIIAPFSYLREKRVVRESTDVVYVTNEFLQNRYPTKGRSTNCSNVALPPVGSEVLERRMEHIQKRSGKYIIGTIGALNVRYKGQQYVIKALKYLMDRGISNFEYQLVGGGDDTYLRKVIESCGLQDCVKIIGRMEHGRIFDWLDSIDIYIQPSRQEGMPRSLIEAMSRGLYCLGARTAGIPELLSSERIFENNSKTPKLIADKLVCINQDALLRDSEINYAVSQEYTEAIIEKRRSEFFDQFISSCNIK